MLGRGRKKKRKKLQELHTDSETEKENVENNPLLKHVPMGLPSAGLSSHCWRLNFKKKVGYSRFFHSAIIPPLSSDSDNVSFDKKKPDTVCQVSL